MTAVLPGAAYYDGRASKDENFHERTGLAAGVATAGLPTARLRAHGERPIADVRYVDAVREPGGALRLFYEAPRPDGAHELRTEQARPAGSEPASARGLLGTNGPLALTSTGVGPLCG